MRFLNKTLLGLITACLMNAGAIMASTFVTFSVDMSNQIANATFNTNTQTVVARGTFNNWGVSGDLILYRKSGTTIYTNQTYNFVDTDGTTIQYKYVISPAGWESTANGNNRAARLPKISDTVLVLPTPYFNDAGSAHTNQVTFRVNMARQIELGLFNPSAHTVYVRGSFNGWTLSALTNDLSMVNTNYGVVTTNIYAGTFTVIGSPNSAQSYKFYYFNGVDRWESPRAGNTDDAGNRYFANAAQTMPTVFFSDDSGIHLSVAGPGKISAPVAVTFTNIASAPTGQICYVIGSLSQLGEWEPTRAVRMVSTNCSGSLCTWKATIGLPEGVTYEYKFMFREECLDAPDCYGSSGNGTLEAGTNRTASTPPGPPAPYDGKAIYYYSAWTNVSVVYSNNLLGWITQAMSRVRDGRLPGESLWFANGLNQAGDPPIRFVFRNATGGVDYAIGPAGTYYETPLDAAVVQDHQIYNYWPPTTVSASRVESFFLNSTNLAGRTVRMYVPRGYNENTDKRYPVLYMHDGENLFLGMGTFGTWNADKNADTLIGLGKMREMLIVGVDSSANRFSDYQPDDCGGNANRYASLLLHELKPIIDSTYRTLTNRDNTATSGSSMGGLVSFYLGWEYSEYFGRIAPISTYFPACPTTLTLLGPPNPAKPVRVYLDSGTIDAYVQNDDAGNNIRARDNLMKNGYVLNIDMLHVIGYEQWHNEVWWDYRTPLAWTFLFPAIEEPNTVLDTAAPPYITELNVTGAGNDVTWTSYRARRYTLQGSTNDFFSNTMTWTNLFTTPQLESRPWSYIEVGVTNTYRYLRVFGNEVSDWPY